MNKILFALCSTLTCYSRIIDIDKGPPQAPSFNPGGAGKIDRSVFKRHELDVGIGYNRFVPRPIAEGIRFATWNTHMLLDLEEKESAVEMVLADLKEIGADVLMMEEIPLKGQRLTDFEGGLESLGYLHRALRFSAEEGAGLGIMVASKIPIESVEFFELGFKRIGLDVGLSGGMHVLGTHLEVTSGSVRREQCGRILAHLKEQDFYNGSFILAGDFNSQYLSDDLGPFRDSPKIVESFRGLNWTHPGYTCWSGAEIDFIFVGQRIMELILGAYIHHSPTSDHLPLIIDIKGGGGVGSRSSQVRAESLTLLVFVVILAGLVYGLALKFLPQSAWNNSYRVLRDFETM